MAKHAIGSPLAVDLISPEDAAKAIDNHFKHNQLLEWTQSKYHANFRHISPVNLTPLYLKRSQEVLLLRLASRSLPTKAQLFKCGLDDSPLCASCNTNETCDHFLLTCAQFEAQREILRNKVGPTPLSFGWLCYYKDLNSKKIKALVEFLVSSHRF
ncbi:hypothetical protein JTE90_006230 [Oedothorax gibbosus]|uniref:Reverse transcriptase zinc-binding domain-containing protein n=1 Tax=Oedothorax gibbosus TaxID=931172 RepID=A0AAV6VVA5_9ARAC|nr:hypothetical protein JTE90_006230 [Oedothorax gibbosus]